MRFIISEKELTSVLTNNIEHTLELKKTGFWGKEGAGAIIMARDSKRLLFPLRSKNVMEPNTWGTWGGALDQNETPLEGLKREISEESGYDGPMEIIPLYVFKHESGFKYYNFLVIIEHEFTPKIDRETQDFIWTTLNELPSPLHFGLKKLLSDESSMKIIKKNIEQNFKVSESNLKELIKKILIEADYNYHVGNLDTSNVEPYGSDSKYMMRGRGTGHFGSGLYFSTYNCNEKHSKVTRDEPQTNPELIQVKDGVYRVDMDIYKNLYKVSTEKQGDNLFQTLKEINGLYTIIDDLIKYKETLPSNFSQRYLVIVNNCKYIGLKIPDYRSFIKMCSQHSIDKDKSQSMSTIIMEYNGYNGVNVSGVPKYDNTLHGSVIYDTTKTSTEFKKVNVEHSNCGLELSKSGEYVAGDIFDFKNRLLKGRDVINAYSEEFNKLPENEQIIAIKRYQYYLNSTTLDEISQNIKNIYFKTLGYKIKNGILKDKPSGYIIGDLIDNNMLNVIYDKSIIFEDGKTLLLWALENTSRLTSSQEDKLINNINRPLSAEEQEELDWVKT